MRRILYLQYAPLHLINMMSSQSSQNDSLLLTQIWPDINYSLPELITTNLFKKSLSAKMNCFINSTKLQFDYKKKAVSDFNEWIRFKIPKYMGYPEIKGVSDISLTSKQAFKQTPDQFRSVDYNLNHCWIKKTSGSTGPPQTINYSSYFHSETIQLTIPKIAYRLGLRPTKANKIYSLTIRDKPDEKPIIRFDVSGFGGHSIRIGVNSLLQESLHLAFLSATKVRPFCISSTPSLLAIISEIIPRDTARNTKTKLIISGGGELCQKTRSRLESLFQAKVCNAYGLSEVGIIASECKIGRMHFNTSDCFPEILPENIYGPGDMFEGEIVITSTANKLMPFLRYQTGDIGRLSYEQCSCGEPSPILEELSGRRIPVFCLPQGRLFSPTQFRGTFEKFPWLKEFQVIQEKKDVIRILYEPSNHNLITSDEECRFRNHFAEHLKADINIYLQQKTFNLDCKFQRYKTLLDQPRDNPK